MPWRDQRCPKPSNQIAMVVYKYLVWLVLRSSELHRMKKRPCVKVKLKSELSNIVVTDFENEACMNFSSPESMVLDGNCTSKIGDLICLDREQ